MTINDDLLELDVVEESFLFVVHVAVLGDHLDLVVLVLLDYLLHALLQEAIERRDLL